MDYTPSECNCRNYVLRERLLSLIEIHDKFFVPTGPGNGGKSPLFSLCSPDGRFNRLDKTERKSRLD